MIERWVCVGSGQNCGHHVDTHTLQFDEDGRPFFGCIQCGCAFAIPVRREASYVPTVNRMVASGDQSPK